MSASFQSLFQPGSIGKLQLKNRLIMAAMGNALSSDKGEITEALLDHYRARAKGGVGLVITQLASINIEDVMPYNLGIYDDKFIPGLRRLVETIHGQGAKASIQLMHPGMLLLLMKSLPQGQFIKVPNLTPRMDKTRPFKEIDAAEIERLIQAFGRAAVSAREAGADAVELHACHGCLLSTFLTPAINHRTDEYGGSVENRARFTRRAVEEIRRSLGNEFPLTVRINGCDDVEGGVTPEEVVQQAVILANAGASAISISSGLEYWSTLMAPSYLTPEGAVIPVAEAVKKAVNIPVIVAGKISPELAEKSISDRKVDFVALGRPLLADPELPNKLQSGNIEDIGRCLYCNNCLRTGSWRSCTVNPFLFRDSASILSPTASPKKIMVVGGGLAGMRAAVMCRMRGHEVALFEKNPVLGGQWQIASSLPGKEGYASVIDYLKHSMEKLKIPVTLNKAVTPVDVKVFAPDIAIVATGAVPLGLDIPGAQGSNVVQANDIISGKVKAKGRVAVIGGRVLGMEAAEFLSRHGHEVAQISRSGLGGRKGPDDMITFRGLLRKLLGLRIPIYLNAGVLEMNEHSVIISLGEEIVAIPADTVVLAVGVKADDRLAGELKGIVPEIFTIGDCMQPGNAAQATFSGARIAMKV